MAKMAVSDGIETIVATPHQLGNNAKNSGEMIRAATAEFQRFLERAACRCACCRAPTCESSRICRKGFAPAKSFRSATTCRHVLLELPHEVYLPLERLLADLNAAGLVGILSHPERNRGILNQPGVLRPLVQRGCLLQVTAGSLTGTFGSQIQKFADSLIGQGLVHFVSTDAHGTRTRPPVLSSAFERVAKLAGENAAIDMFCRNPRAVTIGNTISPAPRKSTQFTKARWFRRPFSTEQLAAEPINGSSRLAFLF